MIDVARLRHMFAAFVALGFLLSAGTLCAQQMEAPKASARAGAKQPNVLFVIADDLGYGELGCYGQKKIATPCLDRLANEGMRFVQAYSGAPVCAPARCVLMTGKHSGRTTIRDNLEHKPEGQEPIAKSDRTIAEMLKANGYATGCFGKWGLGYPGSDGDPLRRGFDRFFGYNCQRHAHDHYPGWLWDDGTKKDLPGNANGKGPIYAQDAILDAAVAFVAKKREQPFFAFVPLTLPHLALQVPDDALARYRGAFEETPYTGKSYRPHATPRACYAAMITHLDACVGRLLTALDDAGIAQDTIVVFTSDNGPTHLAEQVDAEFFGSAGGLRGLKGSVHEGGIRVPLLVRWPSAVAAGTNNAHITCMQDWMPTFAELCAATAPEDADGISLAATLRGDAKTQRAHDELLWDFPGYGGQLALRAGKWKAVVKNLRKDPAAAVELYDLEQDPAESRDLAAEQPERAKQMRERMTALRTEPAFAAFRFGDYAPR